MAILGFGGKDSHPLGRGPGIKWQEIFLAGWEYWESYQVGHFDTKEWDKDFARTRVPGGKLIWEIKQKLN